MSAISAVKPRKRANVMIPDHVCGALVFVFVEIMFYSAFLSAFLVMRRGRDSWGQADAQMLQVSPEGFNGLVLGLSAASVVLALRAISRNVSQARGHLLRATGLALLFCVYQFVLGWKLVAAGVTLQSSVFAGCLYLMLGSHLLQVLLGSAWMSYIAVRFDAEKAGILRALAVFLCFHFAIWAAIYGELFF